MERPAHVAPPHPTRALGHTGTVVRHTCMTPPARDETNPCKPLACDLQSCIQRHQFQQYRCDHIVAQLYRCCAGFYKRHGNDARCASCPEPKKLQEKMDKMG